MRVFVRIGSLFGAGAYIAFLAWAWSFNAGLSAGSAEPVWRPADLLLLCPLVYFGVCFLTSFAVRKGRKVLLLGGGANALLVAFGIALCFMWSTGFIWLLLAAICVSIWLFMYNALDAPSDA